MNKDTTQTQEPNPLNNNTPEPLKVKVIKKGDCREAVSPKPSAKVKTEADRERERKERRRANRLDWYDERKNANRMRFSLLFA